MNKIESTNNQSNNQSNDQSNTFTFTVTSGLNKEKLRHNLAKGQDIYQGLTDKKSKGRSIIEDFSHRNDKNVVYLRKNISTSSFFEAVFMSYANHYNLKLSVSHFIIAIGQALSIHINKNSELLRKEFVSFEGKKEIIVRRDEFRMGEQNDWTSSFGEFCDKIKENTNVDINKVIIDDTSVATQNSTIVSQICLMESMKAYFDYTMMTMCGIPNVSLLGSKEDWKKLKEKVDSLCKLNENDRLKLDWWLKHLVPVIDKIVDTGLNRNVDTEFWKNFAKKDGGSGGPYFSGWINVFYPYLLSYNGGYNQNNNMDYKVNKSFGGLKDNEIPQGISKVPFIWNYFGDKHDLNFYGGFFSTKVNEEEGSVEPELGWVIERLKQDEEVK